jgi:outer membrane protein TolC
MKAKISRTLIFLLIATACLGQSDSTVELSLANFLQVVKLNHPLAKQASLISKTADANTLLARGSFDPKLFYEFNNKYFDAKNYYELGNGGFKVPTWFGIDIKAGYEQNQGSFINPENNVPTDGLLYSQVSVPLLQGLIIDERRATLKQAKLFEELSEFDKILLLNELLNKAGKAYWDWYLSYVNLKVYQNAVTIGQERVEAVKKMTAFGDRPPIDTVEALIQLQDRIISLQVASVEYKTKSLLLSNFLWLENDIPIELTDKTIPESYKETDDLLLSYVENIDSLINIHPSLKVYDFKLKQLQVEKSFKQDKLKPSLNVNFNPLFDASNLNSGYVNNYKWGLTVGFPVLLRKERGDLQLTKIKIDYVSFETKNKRNELLNKTKTVINEFNNYKIQITVFSKNVLNYEQLWKSEKQLFDAGESSLFMINSREMSYINAQIKLNEIINKNKKSAFDVEYSYGLLYSIY